MACTQTQGTATLRHHLLAAAWHHAGCATSAEPACSNLAVPQNGDPGLRRGDILAGMPGGRNTVLDRVVTHPAASSYLLRIQCFNGRFNLFLYFSIPLRSCCASISSVLLEFRLSRSFWCQEKLRFWCLPSFLSVLPSRFVVTQLYVSIILLARFLHLEKLSSSSIR